MSQSKHISLLPRVKPPAGGARGRQIRAAGRVVWIVLALIAATSAHAQIVTFDAAATSPDLANLTSGSWSHTTSGSNRYLVVGLSGWDDGGYTWHKMGTEAGSGTVTMNWTTYGADDAIAAIPIKAAAQITLVQSTGKFKTLSGTSVTSPAFGTNPVVGNRIIVLAWSYNGTAAPTLTASDNQGNTYTSDAQTNISNRQNAAVLSAPVTVSGAGFTVTVSSAQAGSTANPTVNRTLTVSVGSGPGDATFNAGTDGILSVAGAVSITNAGSTQGSLTKFDGQGKAVTFSSTLTTDASGTGETTVQFSGSGSLSVTGAATLKNTSAQSATVTKISPGSTTWSFAGDLTFQDDAGAGVFTFTSVVSRGQNLVAASNKKDAVERVNASKA